MRLKVLVLGVFALFLFTVAARADRGPIVWNEGVELSQDSQKAIILHNGAEEVLILGTELKANKEAEILEFIPFPAEPKVSLAKGRPFDEIAKLIREKGLVFQFQSPDFSKGRGGGDGPTTAPVEIRFSEKIGLHDVTTIKINDIEEFSRWLEGFFKTKGIPYDKEKLLRVYGNARDYLQRGYPYFVFDSVKVTERLKFLEPLEYRFRTGKIYYPLKTSNLIGGTGRVELLFILPGSISDDLWNRTGRFFVPGPDREIHLSTSAKLSSREIGRIYEDVSFFGKTAKTYVQALTYSGGYDFRGDFTYDVNSLVPYAYRHFRYHPIPDMARFEPPLTGGELHDYQQAFCLQTDPAKDRVYVDRAALNCWSFIPDDEYAVFAAVFRTSMLSGIPRRNVVLEPKTTESQYKGKNIDATIDRGIVGDFNEKNRVSYPLDNAFPQDEKLKITVKGDTEAPPPLPGSGRTWISRAGFNKERTRALVYVSHVAGPRAGVGYFVTVEKENGEWAVTGSHLGIIF